MSRIAYIEKRFAPATLDVIDDANTIINEYSAQGFSLTLRQLYYQFVARDLIQNSMREYKRLGKIISNARLAGLIDWRAIEDRTRNVRQVASWVSPASLIESCADQFQYDCWQGQKKQVEVWIEKEALVGVISSICNSYGMPFFACKGYVSQSEQWAASQRILRRWRLYNQKTVILHLGDHDPSGVDMTRDNDDRLGLFTNHGAWEEIVEVERIALNKDQILKYDPPPNPTKLNDSRAREYIENHGYDSWELDALEPSVIIDLIDTHLHNHVDREQMTKIEEQSKKGRERLQYIADNWEEIQEKM